MILALLAIGFAVGLALGQCLGYAAASRRFAEIVEAERRRIVAPVEPLEERAGGTPAPH